LESATAQSSPELAARREPWTLLQKGVFAIAVFQLGWALAGFIAEPTFAVGDDAPTALVLGVDFNGWHALSGLLLFGPALLFATRRDWAMLYAVAAGLLLVLTGIWAFLSERVAYFFTFPNNVGDAILHSATGLLLLLLAGIQLAREQAAH
jgi:hypothetical protein